MNPVTCMETIERATEAHLVDTVADIDGFLAAIHSLALEADHPDAQAAVLRLAVNHLAKRLAPEQVFALLMAAAELTASGGAQ